MAGTDWPRIVALYDELYARQPGPIVALNRGLAIAELRGPEAGRQELRALIDEGKLADYHFFWAALADLERRAGRPAQARPLYARALSLARNEAEKVAYQRRLGQLTN